jgi:hypothetical protein
MKRPPPPREIEVHIEELVLHGFDPAARWDIADALGSELHTLLAQRGIPAAWLASPERIKGGEIPAQHLNTPAAVGRGVATAVHEGGSQ